MESHANGPEKFRATRLWKELVSEFRERLSEKAAVNVASGVSLSVLWRPNYFSGHECVDTLTAVLSEKRVSFGFKEVTKEKARKFCEILLRDKTIAAAPENKERSRFQATKCSFYYFVDDSPSSSLANVAISTEKEHLPSSRNRPLGLSTLSLASVDEFGKLDKKVIREFALSRLLMLVDVPVLEEILHILSLDDPGSLLKTLESLLAGIGRLRLDRNNVSFDDSSSDETKSLEGESQWTSAGQHCLRRCTVKTDAQFGTSNESIYSAVVNAYNAMTSKRGCLIPHQYSDVLAQISHLISTSSETCQLKALEACQCLCLLLPQDVRGQLRSLLQFLWTLREKETYPVNEAWNVEFPAAVNTFRKFIFPTESQNYVRLTEFFVEHAQEILIRPKHYLQQIYFRHANLLDKLDEKMPEITVCERITTEEYKNQQIAATKQALFDVVSNVMDDERMSVSQKLDWFEKFRRQYPDIYNARFPSPCE